MPEDCLEVSKQKRSLNPQESMGGKVGVRGRGLKKIDKPWVKTYHRARYRCINRKAHAYEHYGGRGIKFLMTMDDFKFLWFRYRAYEMKRPSIDRIDNDGNYSLENCRYLEFRENAIKRRNTFRKICKNGHIMDADNVRIYTEKDGGKSRFCKLCDKLSHARSRLRIRLGLPSTRQRRKA